MPPSREFDFRHEAPRSIRERIRQSDRGRDDRPDRQSRTYRRPGRRHQEFGPRRIAPGAHERPLMFTAREKTPERLSGMDHNGAEKFLGLADLSESEEAMDLETGSSDEDLEISKGMKTVDPPKWSNPDPYTVLPPMADEARAKKRDVVKLIRKARINATKPDVVEDSVAVNDDFISLSFGDDSDETSIPTGPKALIGKIAPSALAAPPLNGTNGASNKRKRDAADDVDDPLPPPHLMKRVRKSNLQSKGDVLDEWKGTKAFDRLPWSNRDHSQTLSMGFWSVVKSEVWCTILTII